MKKYDSYKDSGIEWIGVIPSHWNTKRLKFIGNLYSGLSGKSGADFSSEASSNTKPFINFTNVANNKYIVSDNFGHVLITNNENQNQVQKGDLLFLMSSENQEEVGKSALLNNDFGELYLNSFCKGLRISNLDIYPNFLNYLLNSSTLSQLVSIEGRGFTRINLRMEGVQNLPVFFPDKDEQITIANYLDQKTSQIDDLIAKKERLIQLLEEERTAIINQAVTKGLDPTVPMKDSGIEWLGEIPAHWSYSSLKWFSKIYSGGTPSKDIEEYWIDGTIPWLNSGCVNQWDITEVSDYITEDAFNNSSAKWIPNQSLVIALAGQGKTKGMVAQVKFETTCNQSLGVIVPNEKINNRFLQYWLKNNYQNIRSLGGGDKRDGLNLVMIGGIPIPVLPLIEQEKIAKYLDSKNIELDSVKAKTQQEIGLLKEYKTALISEVVTGKVDIRNEKLN